MEKLMIVNCAADTSMHEGVPQRFADSQVLADSVEKAFEAGACIAHIHAPPTNYDAWESHSKAIRDRCGIMLQYGISTQTVEQRKEVVKNHPEMMSVAVGAHNMAFIARDVMMLHPREELAEMMRLCKDYNVKPEFEVFTLGETWMIDDLLQKGLLGAPRSHDVLLRASGRGVVAALAERVLTPRGEPAGGFHIHRERHRPHPHPHADDGGDARRPRARGYRG